MANSEVVLELDELQQQQLALKEFGFKASAPLFRAMGEDADHLATGTFFEKCGKLILLTARHVVDEAKLENIAIAESPSGSGIFTLGTIVVHMPKDIEDAEIDIIGIEILDQSVIEKIRTGWKVLDISVGAPQSSETQKTLVGYPSERMVKDGFVLRGKPVAFHCAPLGSIPGNARQPVNPDLDLFLEYPEKALELGDKTVSLGLIKGMSGCAIWEAHSLPGSEVWSPEKALRLVGIQSSAAKGSFVRGKKWEYIKEVIKAV